MPAASVATFAVLLALSSATPAQAGTPPVGPAQAVLDEMNSVRAQYGLPPLRRDIRLARAARSHVVDLLQTNTFGHGDFAGRLRRFGASGPLFGENLAWGTGRRGSPTGVVRAWLKSPPHRTILLRPGWRRVGVGVAVGSFAGWRSARIVAADFAGR